MTAETEHTKGSKRRRPWMTFLLVAALAAAVGVVDNRWRLGESWRWSSYSRDVSQALWPQGNTSMQAGTSLPGVGVCKLSGTVQDSHCDYASVERVNREHLQPILAELVRKPFFRYFKVDLYCDCPFWPDDGMCSLRDCSVCECDNNEVPRALLAADGMIPQLSASECEGMDQLEGEAMVDRSVDPTIRKQLQGIPGWRGMNNPWMPDDDDEAHDFAYINLLENEERYTGYKGEHPHRIWDLIYSQSCFADTATCTEQRILYRLISGMHASITSHIVQKYLIDEAAGIWGPNLQLFQERLGNHEVKERTENLYFAYLFVLRAVMKAGPYLESTSFHTGCPQDDKRTCELVKQLVSNDALKAACPVPFDEGRLWKSEGSQALMMQLQKDFQQMTKAMDCVGCEKCKLWGKLQLLGIATSLKILFSSDSCEGPTGQQPALELERNEVIALVNLLERLSQSIEIVRTMSLELTQSSAQHGAIEGMMQHPLQQNL